MFFLNQILQKKIYKPLKKNIIYINLIKIIFL